VNEMAPRVGLEPTTCGLTVAFRTAPGLREPRHYTAHAELSNDVASAVSEKRRALS